MMRLSSPNNRTSGWELDGRGLGSQRKEETLQDHDRGKVCPDLCLPCCGEYYCPVTTGSEETCVGVSGEGEDNTPEGPAMMG